MLAEIGRAVIRLLDECPDCREEGKIEINALLGLLRHDCEDAWTESERNRVSMAIRLLVERVDVK
ncbi:TPA: hypothetical protein U2R10_003922 [Proteus mirabilis]|uniref:hypothetical protein n=1 Tax=Morganella morganii TaxID=582 RepID=UPI000DFE68E5|nr:hypothetical protein [Morganella morganii]MDU2633245.1 hypothetical protein [Morganella morganii]STZ19175.1 Uncharacterised protein [Morganella morganii]HCD1106424.1 hypothetical protein [Morganella morganii]HEM8846849.1 hypothetical protein [Proteus mirabilis]